MIEQRYIEVLFNTAVKLDLVDELNEQFEILMTILEENPSWLVILDTPTLRYKVKEQLIKELDVFNQLFVQYLMSLIRNHQISKLPMMYDEWLIKVRLKQKIAFVQLYSAKPLTKKQLAKIKEEIAPLFPDLSIEFNIHIDKSLIRGIRLTYQGRSIERSVKKEIEGLRNHI